MSRADYPQPGLFVAGRWRLGAEGRGLLPVVNPADGMVLAELPMASPADVDEALAAAEAAFGAWRRTPAYGRAGIVRRIGALIRERRELFAATIALELGKPLPEALREADTAAEMFEWAAEECRRSYGRLIPARTPGQTLQASWEPVGPIAAFAPWNAPAITPARKIAGALAAGCTIVLKAAEETPATACLLARAAEDAGAPAGTVNLLFGEPAMISQRLLDSHIICGLTFTGSTEVGRGLASLAGAGLKRMTLELGGHAPVLVFGDVDVEAVAAAAVAAKYRNAGQVCTSPTRFYVQQDVYGRFVDRFTAVVRDWTVGDPFALETRMGPVATPRRLDAMARLAEDARDRGLRVTGGTRVGAEGFFWAPTVLADAGDDCLAANEEPFGPLALIAPFRDADEAVAKANRLPQALAAYAFTHDARLQARLAEAVCAGTLALNHWQASWPETPFGGRGASGFGVEGGVEGLQAFQQIKFVSAA
ncbi:MAG: aldehyde dehydrogenase family protein [Caulobacteraceae bacterium]|nr:aldehyde dehydrogenase family protein [Caulobacteraceae bacterium]